MLALKQLVEDSSSPYRRVKPARQLSLIDNPSPLQTLIPRPTILDFPHYEYLFLLLTRRMSRPTSQRICL